MRITQKISKIAKNYDDLLPNVHLSMSFHDQVKLKYDSGSFCI